VRSLKFGVLFILLFWAFSVLAETPEAPGLAAAEGWVQGDVQRVGFRAFIFKKAIQYNLGGWIENEENGSVHFVFQGEPQRLDLVLEAIRTGPASAKVNEVNAGSYPVQPVLRTLTVKGWTSQSRHFLRPIDLVYTLRPDNRILSEGASKEIYKRIIQEAMLVPPDKAVAFSQGIPED
jgi:acylphosphatase